MYREGANFETGPLIWLLMRSYFDTTSQHTYQPQSKSFHGDRPELGLVPTNSTAFMQIGVQYSLGKLCPLAALVVRLDLVPGQLSPKSYLGIISSHR